MSRLQFRWERKELDENRPMPRLLYTGTVNNDPYWMNLEHTHDFCEILYVFSGKGEVIIDDFSHTVQESDVIIINPGVRHEEKSLKNAPLNLVIMGVDDFTFTPLAKNHLIDSGQMPIINSGKHKYRIESCFADLISEIQGESEYRFQLAESIAYSLLIFILRLYTEDKSQQPLTVECEQIKEMIDKDYTSPITLESLSESLYISKYHLSHIYKKQMGVSPIKYLIQKRIDAACKLLIETRLSISEIAKSVGYDDPTYFGQIFRKTKLMSPTEYRKKHI